MHGVTKALPTSCVPSSGRISTPTKRTTRRPPFMLHIFALFILAQFREQRAYAPIVQMFRNPKFEELTGEVFTENLQAILASVCNGDTSLIEKLIEDEGVDEYVRGSAVESLGILANCGIKTRGEVSGYFRVLFRGRLSRGRNHVWDSLISVCTDLRMAEHLDDIRMAYEGNIADPIFCSLDEVEKEIVLPIDSTARHFRERYKLIDDAVAELEVWSCFDPDHEEDDALPAEDDFFREDSISDTVPFVRDTPKVGRNEPCPCGSGKKYKKCCGSPAA